MKNAFSLGLINFTLRPLSGMYSVCCQSIQSAPKGCKTLHFSVMRVKSLFLCVFNFYFVFQLFLSLKALPFSSNWVFTCNCIKKNQQLRARTCERLRLRGDKQSGARLLKYRRNKSLEKRGVWSGWVSGVGRLGGGGPNFHCTKGGNLRIFHRILF